MSQEHATSSSRPRPFIVEGTLRSWRAGLRPLELSFVHVTGSRDGVEFLRAPESMAHGEEAEVRVRLFATKDFGPGSLVRGDRLMLGTRAERFAGQLRVHDVVPLGADPDAPQTWKAAWRSVLDVTPGVDRNISCPTCGADFSMDDRRAWTGVRHSTCGQKLNLLGIDNQVEPVWCMVGNIVDERRAGPGGEQVWHGTKHFAPGTKVYCYPPLWGDGYERVQVLGRPRHGRELIKVVIKGRWITNRRAKLIYAPAIVDRLSDYWDGSPGSKKIAEQLAQRTPDPTPDT